MPGDWMFYASQLTTGEVVTELPLTGFRGGRHLSGGQMSAGLVLQGLPRGRRRELLNSTAEGKFTVIAERDGQVMGEWIIWRSTANGLEDGPVELWGQEIVSFLDFQPVEAGGYSQTDQMVIAVLIAAPAFAAGGVAVDVPGASLSGVRRDRTYIFAESSAGQRLRELSEVDGGFDYFVRSEWDWSSGVRKVKRTLEFFYPMAGRDSDLVFDQAPPTWREGEVTQRSGGSIVGAQFDRDGTRLGSRALAICAGKGEGRVIGSADDGGRLVGEGWPDLVQMRSWSTVSRQDTADSHAAALLDVSQTAEVPPRLTVLADGDPGLGDWSLGDRVRIKIDETTNLPDGVDQRVRILGWELTPPSEGVETVGLEVTSIVPGLPGDEDE